MRVLAGLTEFEGQRTLGHNVNVQYFSQEAIDMLDAGNTVLGEIEAIVPYEPVTKLRRLLGALLFLGDDVFKKVRVLSGGEKSRLALAKMLVKPGNFLLLDEPTNHLDIESREILKNALVDFTGTVCFVSHDRYLIDSVADKLVHIQPGVLREYLGNYSDLLSETEQADVGTETSVRSRHSRAERQERKRQEAASRRVAYKERKKKEALLVFFKKHTGKVPLTYEEALEEALCFGWVDGKLKRLDDRKHVIRFTPRRIKNQWSDANKLRAKTLIASGRMTPAGRAALPESLDVLPKEPLCIPTDL